MYEGRPLHEVGWEDLEGFLRQGRPEGTRLDYKGRWDPVIARDACAMANTSGGDVIVGVKEIEREDRKAGKTHVPDPGELLGEDGAKDWKTIVESTVRSRTRPPVAVEAKPLSIEGESGLVAVVIRVEESLDAPHEVYVGPDPEIPVRRGANTVSVGLDDVERMIACREASRRPREPLVPEFFEGLLAPDQSYDRTKRGNPPTLAVAIRPRRVPLSFAFDSILDTKLQDLSMDNDLTDNRLLRPAPEGVAMQDPPSGTPRTRIEVRKDATIRGVWALSTQVYDSEEQEGRVRVRVLEFWDLVLPVVRLARFAGAVYALRRPGTEMEVALGLSGCQGCHTRIGTRAPTKAGQIPDSPFYRQPEFADGVVRTDPKTGEPVGHDLVSLVRELSRFFRVSMPDSRLAEYI